jgi:NAD(P)-dependent dehydrogenase (short-subunit alcohol dehydrogenase family)
MSLNPPITHWQGRSVWLVGASSGIGRATAAALHAQGAKVFVSARNADALNAFAQEHAGAVALPLDATDAGSMSTAFATIVRQGPLDCAVYCAGHYTEMRAEAMDLPDMLRHVQINYFGALHMLDAVMPHFLAQAAAGRPGHISLMGSVAGYRGLPQSLAYGPTKAALINLTETLFLDLRSKGIGVSIINPGFVETPLTAQNEFKMPALISADEAASEILKGWRQGRFELHFPKRFTWWLKLLQVLPYRLYFAATRRLTRL